MQINTVIIPAAGLGTRFLPFTKSVPKEMLPILNRPAIHSIIQEGVTSAISHFCIITNGNKPALQDYLQESPELAALLANKKGSNQLESINTLIASAHISYCMQHEPLGLGHAVLMGCSVVGDAWFGVMLPDDLFETGVELPALAQLIEIAKKYTAIVIAVQEVLPEAVSSYGIVEVKKEVEPGLFEIAGIVEKPAIDKAPSRLAAVGRYVFSPFIFDALERIQPGAGGEIQLTDAINYLAVSGNPVLAYTIKGTRYDIGNPLGWLTANIAIGLENPEYAPTIKKMISGS